VRELIDNDRVTDLDRIRLVLLFVLRFEGSAQPQVNTLVDMLKHRHVDDKYIAVCYIGPAGASAQVALLSRHVLSLFRGIEL
jgi:hypothetical protein